MDCFQLRRFLGEHVDQCFNLDDNLWHDCPRDVVVASLASHLDWLWCDDAVYHPVGSTGCCIPCNIPCRQPCQLRNIWKFVVCIQQSDDGMYLVRSAIKYWRFMRLGDAPRNLAKC